VARDDLGVPEALRRGFIALTEGAGAPERIDRLWIFPPRRRGRTETGVLAAGCYLEGETDRRLLLTLAYRAEETGTGIVFQAALEEEGEAPADRLQGVIEGVLRRMGGGESPPRTFLLAGDRTTFDELMGRMTSFEELDG